MTSTEPSRAVRADARRNRERVLDAARVAFGADGSNVSLDEIARRAGVGAGTVYRHFSTKGALFEAVVAHRLAELTDAARALADHDDPADAFFTFADSLAREGAVKRDLVEAFGRAGVELHLGLGAALQELADALDTTLRRAQDAGAVRADVSVDDVINVISGAAFGISQSGGDEERSRKVLAVILDGLRPG